jgi:NAD(P)-dependent dehydrogenase (short-subunit alcohol dehydrogenase family)
MSQPPKSKVALVAGATRGAGRGIAVELGAAGATVYVTGRTTRTHQSEFVRWRRLVSQPMQLVTGNANSQSIHWNIRRKLWRSQLTKRLMKLKSAS